MVAAMGPVAALVHLGQVLGETELLGRLPHMARQSPRQAGTARPPKRRSAPRRGLPPRHDGFPVVGLGASAGGLDAFRRLLAALPAGSGMAFILIQHLDPTHASMMVGL